MNEPTPQSSTPLTDADHIKKSLEIIAVDAPHQKWMLREIAAKYRTLEIKCAEMGQALLKINEIRNSIVAFQSVNFSEHVYPLVAALNDAGIKGMAYEEAKSKFGTMLERTNKAETELTTAQQTIKRLEGVLKIYTDNGAMWERHGYDHKLHCIQCGCPKPAHHEKCKLIEALTSNPTTKGE